MRLSWCLKCATKRVQKLIGNDERNIVKLDRISLHVKAGGGGNGLLRYDGVGGSGGNIYFTCVPDMPFQQIKKNLNGRFRIAAEYGTSSQKLKLVGQNGKHAVLNIPLGIDVVHKESGDVLHKCNKMYQRYLIAKGGAGGNYKNNYKGESGEELNILLHLKLRPNIGLVGLPNAGKSTILQAFIPKKSVKIAAYPFTTLKPQLGFWKADDDDKTSAEPFVLSLADLPGLIDGAADNRGRGHEFMKHLEYADILLIVVDCTGFQMGDPFENPWRSPLECVGILNAELENYLKRLVKKPCVVVLNKTDLVEKQEVEDLKAKLSTKGWHKYLPEALQPKIPIQFDAVTTSSAKFGKIDKLKEELIRVYKSVHFDTGECIDFENYESKEKRHI